MSRLDFLSLYIQVEFFYLFQAMLLIIRKFPILFKTPWVLGDGSIVIGW